MSRIIISKEEVEKRIAIKHNSDIKLLEYEKISEYGSFECCICGHRWSAIVNSVTRGNGCPACRNKNIGIRCKHDIEYVRDYIESFKCKLISEEYNNEKEDLQIQFECGHIKSMNFDCFRSGQRCTCNVWDRFKSTIGNKTKAKILNALQENNLVFVSFSTDIPQWDSDLIYICPEGHEVTQGVREFMRGKQCKICSKELQESSIATFVKEYCLSRFGNEDAVPEYKIIKNPKTNKWLKNDVYIKSLKLSIEVNGLQHYVSKNKYHRSLEEFLEQQYRDNLKKEYAVQNGNYFEIDLRKIKSKEEVIEQLENFIHNLNYKE